MPPANDAPVPHSVLSVLDTLRASAEDNARRIVSYLAAAGFVRSTASAFADGASIA